MFVLRFQPLVDVPYFPFLPFVVFLLVSTSQNFPRYPFGYLGPRPVFFIYTIAFRNAVPCSNDGKPANSQKVKSGISRPTRSNSPKHSRSHVFNENLRNFTSRKKLGFALGFARFGPVPAGLQAFRAGSPRFVLRRRKTRVFRVSRTESSGEPTVEKNRLKEGS